ncbi:Mitochondrial Carrier (MC) protein [Phytophthora megakarya]|uniref:Mitochondrial Carrier (MC) protein n=1 Tax=Phytophthora megakarya TaxID=4795 RepID=A0A225V4H2_9STRA|nr:Mitochondrial Carrier (MC) protein [Phytophthora megakarya]
MDESLTGLMSMSCYAYAGLPHNVVKLRLQTQGGDRVYRYKGVTDALVRIVKEEGIRGLGKGGTPNLACCLLSNPVENAVDGVSKNAVATLQLRKVERDDGMTLQAALEASFISIFVSTVSTVFENITSKLQFQRQPLAQRDYRGPLDCISKVFKREGMTGLFRGYSSVLLRDVPATPIFIGLYHAISPIRERTMGPETLFTPIVTATFATAASLAILYPADVVKAHMQTASNPLTLRDGFRLVFAHHGLRGFYRGGAAAAISGGMSIAAFAITVGIVSNR